MKVSTTANKLQHHCIPVHIFIFCHADAIHCHHSQLACAHADAATFAKARTVVRHTSQPAAGPSQRELRAQLRAQRLQQKAAGKERWTDDEEEAGANELEAAASLVDLMAHETLPETGNEPLSKAQSFSTPQVTSTTCCLDTQVVKHDVGQQHGVVILCSK